MAKSGKKYKIIIEVETANAFQDETQMKFLELMLSVLQSRIEMSHKKNVFLYSIDQSHERTS